MYRALVRLNLIDPSGRRRRDRKWKRWERGLPMELWQMDVVGGFVLADGRRAKALTGVDDHSRFCVSAHLMLRESSPNVCDGLAAALRAHGVPGQILTDNGKVFTGRFNQPPVEVLFDRICRENGIEHLLTQPRSPTTTGKIERFHRALRAEFRTDRVFADLATAQAELDEWVLDYNHDRPHQALDMATPAPRFLQPGPRARDADPTHHAAPGRPGEDRTDGTWVTRRASAVGVVCVSWQQVCLGVAAAAARSTCGSCARSALAGDQVAVTALLEQQPSLLGGGPARRRVVRDRVADRHRVDVGTDVGRGGGLDRARDADPSKPPLCVTRRWRVEGRPWTDGSRPRETSRCSTYNLNWRTLVGFPASYGSDRSSTTTTSTTATSSLAAATLARFDPDSARRRPYGGMVDAADRATPTTSTAPTPAIPYLRDFDIYAGHDWASGHGAFVDGNNQESELRGP